ncbi:BBE domain-containing protein [Haloarculaceae archaeon H-GB2-1]|nr:BBE domain-containing protein [Haloarculaceae archaeon H-GB11]MEA5407375.1 BBE domain-containing protein [Haloarculaceae archaeon H-GB2-1]
MDLSGRLPYTGLQSMLDPDYPDGRHYYWKSIYVDECSPEVVDLLVEYGADSPSSLSTVDVWHLGGAISEVEKDATAFWQRDRPYMVTFEANWDDPTANDENVAWVRDGIADLAALDVASGGYGNFAGFLEDPARNVYGDNYDRLVEVKRRHDPENLFHLNTNVDPA